MIPYDYDWHDLMDEDEEWHPKMLMERNELYYSSSQSKEREEFKKKIFFCTCPSLECVSLLPFSSYVYLDKKSIEIKEEIFLEEIFEFLL